MSIPKHEINRELSQWMAQTIHFAKVSGGTEESNQEDINQIVRATVAGLVRPKIKDAVVCILTKADEIMNAHAGQTDGEDIDINNIYNVMQWSTKTVTLVRMAQDAGQSKEMAEAIADTHIIAQIQRNREWTDCTKYDLDQVVKRTVEWGLTELGRTAMA